MMTDSAALERYDAMDLARGMALLGVAMINVHAIARGWMNHYSLDLATSGLDVMAEYVVGMLFAHRAVPVLAFLLGVGVALQWRRLAGEVPENPASALSQLRSRYIALCLLGVAHGLLLWPGEIVASYGLIVLLILARWPKDAQRLKAWIEVAVGLSLLLTVGMVFGYASGGDQVESMPAAASSFAAPTVGAALAMHLKEFLFAGISQTLIPDVWVLVLIGLWLGQSGDFERWLKGEVAAKTWIQLGWAALMVGSLMELVAAQRGAWDYLSYVPQANSIHSLAAPLTMAGSAVVLLSIARAWRIDRIAALRSFFIAAGRTPLTQFFGQSLIFAIVFNDSLIGWHGDMGRAMYSLVALLSFILLSGFARAWLASGHQRGPVELMWMALAKWIYDCGK
ncbi:MAG: DUF418 domain-containing protein [Betaproteobacteria bacterium]|nr:MAG: DUF418 domain-containing protein [Betaproteobacteria bacterium]TAG46632.1 MAG: DUF418 domain-containing protein [Betaproteobacteria bacterium]